MRPGEGASVSTTSGRTAALFNATSARWNGSGASSGKVLATMGEAYVRVGWWRARRAGLRTFLRGRRPRSAVQRPVGELRLPRWPALAGPTGDGGGRRLPAV